MKRRLSAVAGALIVMGVAAAGALYWAFPVRVSSLAGLTRNYLMSWSAPRGTATIQSNPAFHSAGVLALSPVAEAVPAASAGDRPSYNRTLSSQRYVELNEINGDNVGQFKVLCSYDVDQFAAFCLRSDHGNRGSDGHHRIRYLLAGPGDLRAELAHPRGVPAEPFVNRGAAYMDDTLFRGTQDGRVLAYDFKRRASACGSRPSPIRNAANRCLRLPLPGMAWSLSATPAATSRAARALMDALDAKTGSIVWEFFLVPRSEAISSAVPRARRRSTPRAVMVLYTTGVYWIFRGKLSKR